MLAVEEGDWLVTSLGDDFLWTDVIREMLDSPQSAKLFFRSLNTCIVYRLKQRFAGISDHSLVFVMELV